MNKNEDTGTGWSWVLLPFLFALLLIFMVIYDNNWDFDAIPEGTQIECKMTTEEGGFLYSNTYYWAISNSGEKYRLELVDWALLNVPQCSQK